MIFNKFNVLSLVFLATITLPQTAIAVQYTIRDLGTFGGDFSDAFAISDNGYISGTFGTNDASGFPLTNNAYLFDSRNNTFVDIGASTTNSFGFDVNSSGQVTGMHSAGGETRVFLYNAGTFNDLGTMGGDRAIGEGINSIGHITGYSTSFSTVPITDRAFVYDGNTVTDIGTLSGGSARAHDINDSGHVTGGSDLQAFYYDGASMFGLPTLGGSGGTGFAINEQNNITGQSNIAGDQYFHAFLYDGTNMVDLGTLLNDTMSQGLDINDHDQVVGMSTDGAIFSAFLYDQGAIHDLCILTDCITNGWDSLAYANGINNHGEIVGYGWIDGERHAFLATVIPIPTAVWLFGSGLIGLIAIARKRRKHTSDPFNP